MTEYVAAPQAAVFLHSLSCATDVPSVGSLTCPSHRRLARCTSNGSCMWPDRLVQLHPPVTL